MAVRKKHLSDETSTSRAGCQTVLSRTVFEVQWKRQLPISIKELRPNNYSVKLNRREVGGTAIQYMKLVSTQLFLIICYGLVCI